MREDFIKYKRKDKCLYVGLVISYEKWMQAELVERVNLFSDNLIASVEKVPAKYLLLDEKDGLIKAINNVRNYLIAKE